MREELANLVCPVLNYGIRLKELVASQEPPEFRNAQKELLALLQPASPDREFMGDGPAHFDGGSGRTEYFLGARYALVCWLDEIFIDSPWKREFSENSLETALFQSRERAWKFWDQARRAETRPGTDALEVFYLCVMLGFRGDLEGMPEKLKAWRDTTEAQLKKSQEADFPMPPDGRPVTYVPPLWGERRRHKMAMIVGLALLIVIPAAVFLLFSQFRN